MITTTAANLPATVSCGKERWSAQQLGCRVGEAAERLSHCAGTLRLIREPNILDALAQLLGAHRAGVVPAMGDPRWQNHHWHALVREFDGLRLPQEAAWATFTSGSTGSPRLLVRTAESWHSSFTPLAEVTGLTSESTILLPVTALSSMTVFSIAHAAFLGAHLRFPERARLCASDLEGVDAAHLTPSILSDLVRLREEALGASRPLTAIVGGDRLDTRQALRAKAVNIRVVPYFGSAELSFLGLSDGDPNVFRAFPGVELRGDIPAQSSGRLLVHTPYAAIGSITRASAATVRPLPRTRDGWFLSDDLAYIQGTENGQRFRLLGRADGAILTAAATVRPEEVEAVLREVPGVTDALVFGLPVPQIGNLVAALIVPESVEPRVEDVRLACAQHLPRSHQPRRFWTGAIPRTASGKPLRAGILGYVNSDACTEFRPS